MRDLEQLVSRARKRVDVDAVGADARELEQRVERPQRRGESARDRGVGAARDRVQLVDPDRQAARLPAFINRESDQNLLCTASRIACWRIICSFWYCSGERIAFI